MSCVKEMFDVVSTFFSFPIAQWKFPPSVFWLESPITLFPKMLSESQGPSRPGGLSASVCSWPRIDGGKECAARNLAEGSTQVG